MSGIFKTMWRRMRAEHLPQMEEIEQFGADGEEDIYRTLDKRFDCVIRNVIVPHKSLYLEKDFLVIHKGVPFVIEVKNWKGEIGCAGNDFYQFKQNGVKKTLKSPVGTTNQFTRRMSAFYHIDRKIYGMVVFCDTDCTLHLPDEMEGVALLKANEMVKFINTCVKKEGRGLPPIHHERILRCTRFYSRDSEFCKGLLADSYMDCLNADGDAVRVDTTCLRYVSVKSQPLRMRDKLLVTYTNGATDVFYNKDTVLTVGCLDGSYREIALNRIRHIVF